MERANHKIDEAIVKHLDDLPKRDSNHETQEIAETAFRIAVSECRCFAIQKEDRNDYGTDFQLEVIDGSSMTNIRVDVQLKGTKSPELKNGSVSRSVTRTNLNYLLQQPSSIYVCYHEPSQRLLARYAEDVCREYDHQGDNWRNQSTVTVGFTQLFDDQFQSNLKNRASALAKSSRNNRILYTTSLPEQLPKLLRKSAETVIVPTGVEQARGMLDTLYASGEDEIISNSFDQFYAELNCSPKDMMQAYMAEINIGMNGVEFDEGRVRTGIEEITKLIDLNCSEIGSLLYSIGNGWLALREYEKARDIYNSALHELDRPELSEVAAQCNKNMGTVMKHISGDDDLAIAFYERAIELSPQLSEAHFAVALCYRQKSDFPAMLEHLDQVVFINRSESHNLSLQGWRVEALFNNGDASGAFREINTLVTHADNFDWIWSWCARQVVVFGRDSALSAQKAIQFWNLYLQEYPENIDAKQERLFCFLYRKSLGEETEINFYSFKGQIEELIDNKETDIAFLWDRIGHWAQYDGNWDEAETYYRKAYELEPERYGYCIGTALNFVGKFDEALPILLDQAEKHSSDAMSWFQVAVACKGKGDVSRCLFAYHKAIELDPEYDLAWFNLGGTYWNSGDDKRAFEIWGKAIERFPTHELVEKLRQNFPALFIN